MPTGYTSELQERDQLFAEFVWRCARAFGALIMMREERMDAPVPERFEVDAYYVESLAKARARMVELKGTSALGADALAAADYDTALKYYAESCARTAATRDRYGRMLAQVI